MNFKSLTRYFLYKFKLSQTYIHFSARIDQDSILGNPVYIKKHAQILSSKIEDNVLISPHCVIQNSTIRTASIVSDSSQVVNSTVEPYSRIYHDGVIGNTKIGSYSYINNNSHIDFAEVGKFCSIGPFLICGYGSHPIDLLSTSPIFFSTEKQCGITFADQSYFDEREKIVIGNDVWMGARVFIRDGVKIGNGAVIGAGAVIVKDVPDYAVVGGTPAKIIRYRFDDNTIVALQKIQWWNWDEQKLRQMRKIFTTPEFIEQLLAMDN